MSRKQAREDLYKLVFEFLFHGNANEETYKIITNNLDLNADDKNYLRESYIGIIANFEEITAKIEKYSKGYSIERIFKPDLAAIIIAVYEITKNENIPPQVSINEAIELVKKYSSEKSYSFVNGILSSVVKELKDENN
jgi:N utilization substance protein B